MARSLTLLGMGITLCTSALLAQTSTSAKLTSVSTSPVAYVYVSHTPVNSGNLQVLGWKAAANGSLTPIPGSPFAESISTMAVNGKYLFGAAENNFDVNSYLIEPDGSLRYAASTNVNQKHGCGSSFGLGLDHTGASLYNFSFYGDQYCANNIFQAFAVNKPTGKLTYLNETSSMLGDFRTLSFIGDNIYGYASGSYHFGSTILGVRRNADGSLTELNINPTLPKARSGYVYDTFGAAADPLNHVAIPVVPFQGYGTPYGTFQLATYTASSTGNLTTTSTYANMSQVDVGFVNILAMAPSGKLLAVGGATGLQVFHFNGANPITHDTGVLASGYFTSVYWDNENHLYALSIPTNGTKGELYVFTITPTGYTQAPGSPHAINSPSSVIVQPLPRY